MPYCLKCGAKIEDEMAFCPECGAKLKEAEPTQAPSQPELIPKQDKAEAQQKQQKPTDPHAGMRHQKPEYGFIKYPSAGWYWLQ